MVNYYIFSVFTDFCFKVVYESFLLFFGILIDIKFEMLVCNVASKLLKFQFLFWLSKKLIYWILNFCTIFFLMLHYISSQIYCFLLLICNMGIFIIMEMVNLIDIYNESKICISYKPYINLHFWNFLRMDIPKTYTFLNYFIVNFIPL